MDNTLKYQMTYADCRVHVLLISSCILVVIYVEFSYHSGTYCL